MNKNICEKFCCQNIGATEHENFWDFFYKAVLRQHDWIF